MDGVLLTPLRQVAHPKGDVFHAIKASSPGYCGFGEAYFSTVRGGLVKGWKRHNRLTLNLVVAVGRIEFVLHDTREGSASAGEFLRHVLGPGGDSYARLTVAPGIWVAFRGLADWNLLLNVIAEEHDPSEADNIDLTAIPYEWSPTPP